VCSETLHIQDSLSVEGLFCSCDLDVDPSILIYKLDLNILNVYLHTKTNFLGRGFQKLEHCSQTDANERINTGGKITYTIHQRSLYVFRVTIVELTMTNNKS